MPNFTLLKKTYYFTVVISLNSANNSIATVAKQKIVQAHVTKQSIIASASNNKAKYRSIEALKWPCDNQQQTSSSI